MPKQLELVNTFFYHHQPYNYCYNNRITPSTAPPTTITPPRQACFFSPDAYATTSYGQVINNKAATATDLHHAQSSYLQGSLVNNTPLSSSPPPPLPKGSKATSNRTCYECNHTFTRPRDLRRHLEQSDKHNAVRRVQCSLCLKSFTREDVMKRHCGRKRCLERFLAC